MTIHQIECFLEAAKTRNFTEAANRLYISQQGLSRQIASLEKELGMKLFQRTTREVKLTRSGELLLWRWKNIPKDIYDSVELAREAEERTKSRIRMAVADMNGVVELAANILADYMAWDQRAEFEISQYTNFKDIANDSPDALLTISFVPSLEQFKDKCGLFVLKEFPICYTMSSRNPLASKESLALEDFKGETMLCLYRDLFGGAEMQFFDVIFSKEHALNKVRYYDNIQNLELALLANEGIHIGFREMYHNFGDKLTMLPAPDAQNQAYAKAVIMWRNENENKLRRFIQFLKNLDN